MGYRVLHRDPDDIRILQTGPNTFIPQTRTFWGWRPFKEDTLFDGGTGVAVKAFPTRQEASRFILEELDREAEHHHRNRAPLSYPRVHKWFPRY